MAPTEEALTARTVMLASVRSGWFIQKDGTLQDAREGFRARERSGCAVIKGLPMQLTNASRRAMRKQKCATAKSWSTFACIEQSADVSAAYRSPFEGGLRQSVRGAEGRIPERQRRFRPVVERTVCRRPQWGFRRNMRRKMSREGGANARPSLKDVSPCGELAALADCWPLIDQAGCQTGLSRLSACLPLSSSMRSVTTRLPCSRSRRV